MPISLPPISLPPISRRRFLARSLVAGAGLWLGPKLFGADKRTDPDSWALLSDTHIAARLNHTFLEVNMADHLRTISLELTGLPAVPAGVFVTGDCAFNSGEKGDYGTFTNLLLPLREGGMPVHLTLGNHDNRRRFWEVLQDDKTVVGAVPGKQVARVSTPRANWLVLDSLEQTLFTPGLLGQAQLDWLAATLDADRDKPALVLVHHNLEKDAVVGLKDTEALLKVIRPRKQVKACIFGHTHHWKVTQDESGIHLVNLPPTAYVFHRGDPSGWVQATLKDDGLRMELRCVNPKHPDHGQIHDLKWRIA